MVKKHKYKIGQECILRKKRRNSILPKSYDGKKCYIVKNIPAEKWDNEHDPEYVIEIGESALFANGNDTEYGYSGEFKYAGIHESELEKKIRR